MVTRWWIERTRLRIARWAGMTVLVVTVPACTLVGYPSGSVPDVDLPPPGPIQSSPPPASSGDREAAERDTQERPRRETTRERDSGEVDPEDVLDSRPAPLTREPENRSDAGREYEVWGVRYQVLESPVGYEATGVASWYGEQFNGRPTASGEIFDMHGFSAAHRTLPLHTWVEVTNLDNGRRAVVKVNDRGPFADTDTRIIDLSMGAAEVLGMVGAGLANVRLVAVEPPGG